MCKIENTSFVVDGVAVAIRVAVDIFNVVDGDGISLFFFGSFCLQRQSENDRERVNVANIVMLKFNRKLLILIIIYCPKHQVHVQIHPFCSITWHRTCTGNWGDVLFAINQCGKKWNRKCFDVQFAAEIRLFQIGNRFRVHYVTEFRLLQLLYHFRFDIVHFRLDVIQIIDEIFSSWCRLNCCVFRGCVSCI